MRFQWWTLPGPSQFVERAVADLQNKRNVVLCVPSLDPEGLLAAIKRPLRKKRWRWVRYEPQHEGPLLDQLFNNLIGRTARSLNGGSPVKHADLATHGELDGLVVALDLSTAEDRTLWIRFLSRYSEALRHVGSAGAPRFVAQLRGPHVRAAPESQVHLSVREWKNVTREIDVRHVAEQGLHTRGLDPLQHQLAVETIARVALWDLDLASELTRQTVQEVSAPYDQLEEYAQRRGWAVDDPPTWEAGTADRFFGEKQIHSALCVIKGELSVVKRRVWAAQAGVMLPFLEARLRDLIEGLNCLPDSMEVTVNGRPKIIDKEHFELTHIRSEIRGKSKVSAELREIVSRLNRIRNRLAHLEPMTSAELEPISFSRFRSEVHQN